MMKKFLLVLLLVCLAYQDKVEDSDSLDDYEFGKTFYSVFPIKFLMKLLHFNPATAAQGKDGRKQVKLEVRNNYPEFFVSSPEYMMQKKANSMSTDYYTINCYDKIKGSKSPSTRWQLDSYGPEEKDWMMMTEDGKFIGFRSNYRTLADAAARARFDKNSCWIKFNNEFYLRPFITKKSKPGAHCDDDFATRVLL
jgi:hypothetical protein